MSLQGQEKEPHRNQTIAEIATGVAAAILYMFERFFVLVAHIFTEIRDLASKLISLFSEVTAFLIGLIKSAVQAVKNGSAQIAGAFLELIVLSLNWCKAWIVHATPNRGKGKDKGGEGKAAASPTMDMEWGQTGGFNRPFGRNPSQDNGAVDDPNILDDIGRAENIEISARKIAQRADSIIKNDVAAAVKIAERYDYYVKSESVPENINEKFGSISYPRSNLRYSGEVRIASRNTAPHRYEAMGYGALYNGSEIVYRGQMQGDLRHGFGVSSQPGERYEGVFSNDKYNGLGKLIRSNFVYTGEFRDGDFSGIGVLEYKNSVVEYTHHFGEFLHGAASGYGVRMMLDGHSHKGLFERGVEVKWRSSKITT